MCFFYLFVCCVRVRMRARACVRVSKENVYETNPFHSFILFFSYLFETFIMKILLFSLYQYFNLNFLSMCCIYFDCTRTKERTNEPTNQPTHTHQIRIWLRLKNASVLNFIHTVHARTHTPAFCTLKWNLLSLWFIPSSCIFMYGFFFLIRYFISIVSTLSLSLRAARAFAFCFVLCHISSCRSQFKLFCCFPYIFFSSHIVSCSFSFASRSISFSRSIRFRSSINSTSSVARDTWN